jgi:hypothetical protein
MAACDGVLNSGSARLGSGVPGALSDNSATKMKPAAILFFGTGNHLSVQEFLLPGSERDIAKLADLQRTLELSSRAMSAISGLMLVIRRTDLKVSQKAS